VPSGPAQDEAAPGRRLARGSLAAFGSLLAVSTAVSLSFWPGHMDPDTLDELNEGIHNTYTNWHAPILSAMYRLIWLIGLRSPGWVLLAGVLTLAVGFYLILRLRLPRTWSVALATLCLVFPPVLSWEIQVGRDAWFTAFLVCGFGLAARAWQTRGRSRWAWIAGALIFAFLANVSRQNGVPAVLVLCCALAFLALGSVRSWRRTLVIATGVVTTLALLGMQTGIEAALQTQDLHPDQVVYIYDLAMMSRDEGKVLFPTALYPSQNLQPIVEHSTTASIDGILFGPTSIILIPLPAKQYGELRSAWVEAITRDPEAYVRERAAEVLDLLNVTGTPVWITQYPEFDPGYSALLPPVNSAAMSYVLAFAQNGNNAFGGVIFTAWVYVLFLLAAAVWFLRRRTAADWIPGLFAVALLLYVAALGVLAPGVIYRYVYPAIAGTTVLAALLVGVALAPRFEHLRSSRTVVAGELAPTPPPASED